MDFNATTTNLYIPMKGLPEEERKVGGKALSTHAKNVLLGKMRNGRKNTKKLVGLTDRHLRIVALYLTGEYSNINIAEMIGCPTYLIGKILNDPLVEEVIEDFRLGQVKELEGLYPKVVSTIRECLDSGDSKIRLGAVDRFIKMSSQVEDAEAPTTNISITVNNARQAFVDRFKEMKDITPLVEITESSDG